MSGAEQHMLARDAVLHVLRELYDEKSPRLPVTLDELDDNVEGYSRKTVKNTLTLLVQQGLVRRVETGLYEPVSAKEAYTPAAADAVENDAREAPF